MRYLFRRGRMLLLLAVTVFRVNPEILSWMTLYPAENAPFLRTPAVIAAILITPRARVVISTVLMRRAIMTLGRMNIIRSR